jgi:hypothetical protein
MRPPPTMLCNSRRIGDRWIGSTACSHDLDACQSSENGNHGTKHAIPPAMTERFPISSPTWFDRVGNWLVFETGSEIPSKITHKHFTSTRQNNTTRCQTEPPTSLVLLRPLLLTGPQTRPKLQTLLPCVPPFGTPHIPSPSTATSGSPPIEMFGNAAQ